MWSIVVTKKDGCFTELIFKESKGKQLPVYSEYGLTKTNGHDSIFFENLHIILLVLENRVPHNIVKLAMHSSMLTDNELVDTQWIPYRSNA